MSVAVQRCPNFTWAVLPPTQLVNKRLTNINDIIFGLNIFKKSVHLDWHKLVQKKKRKLYCFYI